MKPHLPHQPAQPASCTCWKAPRGRRVAGALLALDLAGAAPLPSLGSTTEAVRQLPVVARSSPSPSVVGNTAFIQEQLSNANLDSLSYEPGTSWNCAHINYVSLGVALEKITGQSIPALMQERIFDPLQLRNTRDPAGTPEIADPVLHSFTSERRETLGIAPTTRFYEESTYWNPSWTLAQGAIQYTNILDMATSAEAIGSGHLLSPESHQLQIAPKLRGFGAPLEGCATFGTLTDFYTYGIGIVIS